MALPAREAVRYTPFVLVGGALVGLALGGFRWHALRALHGAFIAFTCFATALGAEVLLHRWFERHPEQWWRRALAYFIAAQIGWPIGIFLGMPLFWGVPIQAISLPRVTWIIVLITTGAGALGGVGAYGYERMKERLRASIEQLKEKEFAEKEMELAREFQARMLPAPDIAEDGYRITARNLPARFVAGDFYDVFRFADGAVGLAIADVAGKGLGASLIMASVKAVLPLIASTRSVEEAMRALNEKLAGELGRRQFVALAMARYEPQEGSVTFANGGLPDPYLIRADGSVETLWVPGPRLPLGLRKTIDYASARVVLGSGDALLFLSDGLPEATTPDGEPLGYDRFLEILRACSDADAILQRVGEATGGARDDDQTLLLLRRTAT
ncbi:MAG TPA: PP2C family protein-serine/threonine phosphatase [Thermoanaerobaculia bacterium]|nr:PP2C family protein-serine/threonine phosphatase [Thermoanaerobaculia bacterium]